MADENNIMDLYVSLTVDEHRMQQSFNEAGKSATRLSDIIKGTLISNAIQRGIDTLISSVQKLGSFFVDTGKQAFENYAQYEQLIGGVETLFKNSADAVKEYAQDAYRTAGVSANEYMDTVTSFSASLIQSLGGDTKQAADIANMAIIDMSDNANKMGTDMAMIQNAYQGFAKQNFTMLDNLKLGYGGTQEEMKRLLEDASKLSGIKYNISSFSDIAKAIHVIQENMDIAGTTSKEAADTIEGSVGSMRAAWQNFVTAIADPKQNLDELLNKFIDSFIAAGAQVEKRVIELLPRLVAGFERLLAELAPQLLEMIDTFMVSMFGEVGGRLVEILVPTLVAVLTGAQVVVAVSSFANTLNLAVTAIEGLIATAGGFSAISGTLGAAFTALTGPIGIAIAAIGAIVLAIKYLWDTNEDFRNAVKTAWDKITEAAVAFAHKIHDGFNNVVSYLGNLKKSFLDTLQGIKDKITGFPEWAKQTGKDFIDGLINGIKEKAQALKDSVMEIVDTVKSYFTSKDAFDIHSPSKWAKGVGGYITEGLAEGITSEEDTALQASRALTAAVKSGFDMTAVSGAPFAFGGFGGGTFGMMQGDSKEEYTINLVVDGETLARTMFRPFEAEQRRRGVSLVNG